MTAQILRTILAGILAGVAVFFAPWILIKILLFFLIIKAIFSLLGWGWRGRYYRSMQHAYAQGYKNMSEDERKAYWEKYGHHCGGGYCGQYKPEKENQAPKDSL